MSYSEIMETVGKVVDAAGVAVIIIGVLLSTVSYIKRLVKDRAGQPHIAYRYYRAGIGRGILLGLEILIAGDIIRTVAVDPTFQNLGTLAILVLIRTFLSVNLEMEIEGRWPWKGKGAPGLSPGKTPGDSP